MTASPCSNVCLMDEASGLCQGCWRTLAEIGAWGTAGEQERQAILAEIAGRRDRLGRDHRDGHLPE
jgi:predicted Fe-S protein YdhL (DUF1289 family)